MPNLNVVMLMGNLCRDPELKTLPSGIDLAEFGLAINRTWIDKDGQKKEEACFVDCAAFGKTATTLAKYTRKGSPLFVEGRLKLSQWEAQDGSKRSKLSVIVQNFEFLERKPSAGGDEEPASEHPARPARRPAPAQAAPVEEDAGPFSDADIPF